MDKAKYEAPVLIRVGSFEEITMATGPGAHVDAFFPGEPDSKLTFS